MQILQRPFLRRILTSGATVIITLLVTFYSIHAIADQAERIIHTKVQESLLNTIKLAETYVDTFAQATLTHREQDSTALYKNALSNLQKFREKTSLPITFIYTCREIEGKIYFVLDPTPPGDANGDNIDDKSYLMDTYEEAPAELRNALTTQKTVVTAHPYTDRWGTFMSAYAPLFNEDKLVGVLGLDINANQYANELISLDRTKHLTHFLAVLIAIFAGIIHFFLLKRMEQAHLFQERLNERFKLSFERAGDGYLICKNNWEIAELNQAATQFGFSLGENIITKLKLDRPSLEQSLATNRTYTQDTTLANSSLTLQFNRLATDDLSYFVSIRDNTLQVRAREELVQAHTKAVEAAASKSRFLATMSHEIRTPMNGVLGMVDLLETTELTPEQRTFVDTIKSSGQSLLVILNDVLDYSKIEFGEMDVPKSVVDSKSLLQNIEQLFKPLALKKGLTLTFSYDLPKHLFMSEVRFKQVLGNLIHNAIKFTHKGEIHVKISLGESQRMFVEVLDTGIGITKEQQTKLFKAFSQGDAAHAGGTGLGLIVSQKLTELMGGELQLKSSTEAGTCFQFWIPVEIKNGSSASLTPFKVKSVAPNIPILVVEDNKVNQLVIQRILEKLNCKVFLVEDGDQALTAVNTYKPALIFMDMQMSRMGGIEATQHLRSAGHKMPIIALTANATNESKSLCLNAGMNGFLPKPITLELIERILAGYFPA